MTPRACASPRTRVIDAEMPQSELCCVERARGGNSSCRLVVHGVLVIDARERLRPALARIDAERHVAVLDLRVGATGTIREPAADDVDVFELRPLRSIE